MSPAAVIADEPGSVRPAPAPAPLGRRRTLLVFAGLMSAMFVGALDQTIVAAALPTIVGELRAPELYASAVTAYLLTETVATPLLAKAGDLYGRKSVLRLSIVIFLVGSVLCAVSQEMWQLVVARGVQGIGAGGLLALPLGVIADLVPARERGRYQGWFVSVFVIASIAGPLLGGLIVDGVGWRWVFYVNVPVALAALAITQRVLPSAGLTSRSIPIDWSGAALLTGGLSALVLATSLGGHELAWGSPQIVALLLTAAALLAGFVLRERVAAEPIVSLRLFASATFRVSTSLAFVVGAVMFGALAFLPLYLQVARGYSATEAGLMLVPILLAALASSTIVGRLISRHGRYRHFPITGMACLAGGLLVLARVSADIAYAELVPGLLLLGAAVGLSMPALGIAAQNAVAQHDVGVASASVTFSRSLGGAVGAAAFGVVLIAQLDAALPRSVPGFTGGVDDIVTTPARVAALPVAVREGIGEAFASSLHIVLLAAAAFALIAFALSWRLPDIRL